MALSIYSADFCDDSFSYLMESFYHRETDGYTYHGKLSVYKNDVLLKSVETAPIHSFRQPQSILGSSQPMQRTTKEYYR